MEYGYCGFCCSSLYFIWHFTLRILGQTKFNSKINNIKYKIKNINI